MVDEKYVASSLPVRGGKKGDNGSRSSSSSSSSDSGSSSTGSMLTVFLFLGKLNAASICGLCIIAKEFAVFFFRF